MNSQEFFDAADRGLHYGDGVFTTLRVVGRKPLFWQRHIERLILDCQKLGIEGVDAKRINAALEQAVHQVSQGVVKIIVTRGIGGRGYRCPEVCEPTVWFGAYPLPTYPNEPERCGVKVRYCDLRLGRNPKLAGIKHLNRLEQVLARREWNDPTIAEGLLCDSEGYVIEGVMSNVFAVAEGRVLTPRLDQCGVAGVMRAEILRWCEHFGIERQERLLVPADLNAADELFLSNSVIGIWPVVRCGEQSFSLGPVTRRFQERLAAAADEGADWFTA